MKEIFPEILKPEEYSGFNPGEPDDDTFILEAQATYPAQIPTFEEEEKRTITLNNQTNVPQVQNEILEPPAEGSVWDIFQEEPIEQSEVTSETAEEVESSVEFEKIDFKFDELESKKNEYLFADDVEIIKEEQTIEETIAEVPKVDETLQFDQDFLEQLKKDLEISESKKVEKKELEDLEPVIQKDVFTSNTDEEGKTIFVVISDLKVDEKAQDKIEEDKRAETKSEVIDRKEKKDKTKLKQEKQQQKAKERIAKDKNKEKINKSVFLNNLFKNVAIFILFVVLGLGGYYIWDNIGYKKINEGVEFAKNLIYGNNNKEKLTKEKKNDITQKQSEEKTHQPEIKTEFADENKELKPEIISNPEKEHKSFTNKKIAGPKIKAPKEEVIIPKQPKIKEPKIETPRKIEKKPQPKFDFADSRLVTTPKEKSLITKKEEEIYTIQVYATPSIEDAQNWVKQLRMKYNIEAYISPQYIRDKIWYRVRFGNFQDKEEAIATAIKFGFSQSWIDRIK